MKKWMYVCTVILVSTLMMSCSSTQDLRITKHSSKKSRTSKKSISSSRVYAASNKTRKKKSHNSSISLMHSTTSDKRGDIVSTAKEYLSIPYRYGGKTPAGGFDCSGFTSYVYKKNGVIVDGPSYIQAKKGVRKDLNHVEIGDLIVFGDKGKVSHVAIVAYHDNNSLKVVHSTSSRGVVVDEIKGSDYWNKRFLYAKDVIN